MPWKLGPSFIAIESKVSRIQSIPLNQNKFQNNSEAKIHRSLYYTLIDIYEWIQAANKYIYKEISL